jgi:hypothetical protein
LSLLSGEGGVSGEDFPCSCRAHPAATERGAAKTDDQLVAYLDLTIAGIAGRVPLGPPTHALTSTCRVGDTGLDPMTSTV